MFSEFTGIVQTALISTVISATSIFGGTGCISTGLPPTPSSPAEHTAAIEINLLSLKAWPFDPASKIETRLKSPSKAMLSYLREDNKKWGLSEIPRAVEQDNGVEQDVLTALSLMPKEVRRAVATKLAGLILVEQLGSSAYSESVLDASGNPVGGFVVLDVNAIDKKANEWATWRESTVFTDDPSIDVNLVIANSEENNRVTAILFILLHEFGHVVAQGETFHPNFMNGYKGWSLGDTPFHDLSWSTPKKGFRSRYDDQFSQRRRIKFYASPDKKVPEAKAEEIYRALDVTNFPSLYAATAPYDDFAESFATYVHQVMLNRPYRLEVKNKSEVVFAFRSCWEKNTCPEKLRLLSTFLAQYGDPDR